MTQLSFYYGITVTLFIHSRLQAQDSDAFDLGVPGGQEASVVFNAVDLSHASPITASAAMKEAGQTGAAFDVRLKDCLQFTFVF